MTSCAASKSPTLLLIGEQERAYEAAAAAGEGEKVDAEP